MFDVAAPAIAVAQGFGRIGCFAAGCCYGKETTSALGVVFKNSPLHQMV
ncbi:prolipoprotein diacylglyceryl transferase family protein [Caloramator sp. mosi_1]